MKLYHRTGFSWDNATASQLAARAVPLNKSEWHVKIHHYFDTNGMKWIRTYPGDEKHIADHRIVNEPAEHEEKELDTMRIIFWVQDARFRENDEQLRDVMRAMAVGHMDENMKALLTRWESGVTVPGWDSPWGSSAYSKTLDTTRNWHENSEVLFLDGCTQRQIHAECDTWDLQQRRVDDFWCDIGDGKGFEDW